MKLKPLLIAIALLAILAVIAYRGTQPDSKGEAVPAEQNLLQPELFSQVTQIKLKTQEDANSLEFTKNAAGFWILEDYYGVPVDFEKLSALVDKCIEGRIIRSVTRNPERIKRLDIGEKHILLLGEDANPLWELETGKSGPSGGTFIRLDQNPEILLAELDLYFNTQKEDWADKTVLDFTVEEIVEISISFSEETTSLILTRETQGAAFSSAELGEDQQVKQDEVTRFLKTLINARLTRVVDAADPDAIAAKAHETKSFILKRFNEDLYALNIGRRPTPPDESKTEEETTDAEANPEPQLVFIFYEFSDSANPWQSSLENAALIFPESMYTRIPKTRQKFIETIEKSEQDTEAIDSEK